MFEQDSRLCTIDMPVQFLQLSAMASVASLQPLWTPWLSTRSRVAAIRRDSNRYSCIDVGSPGRVCFGVRHFPRVVSL